MLYIRTDMNPVIATGHMMRCLAIADAAKSTGENTVFILADNQAVPLLEQRGYSYIVLNSKWDDMESELPELEKLVQKKHIKKMLVDSYQVTENYLKCLTALAQTYYIDDINAFSYPVSGIICYANYWEKFCYSERYTDTKLFLGTEYAPLGRNFSDCDRKEISRQVRKLLLLSGGTDHYHLLDQMLERLDLNQYLQIDAVCGKYNLQYDYLREKFKSHKNVHIHQSVSDMDRLMKEADVAVSAGGTTLYELCAVGTPTVSYSFVDNQLDNVRKFHEDEIMYYAGDARNTDITGNIMQALSRYCNDFRLRQERSGKMQKLVDGKGALRIAEVLA